MKKLFLVRHAKSNWDDPALPDEDRPLNARGRRDAPKMGKRLAKRDVRPDLILSSPARRALKTAEVIAKKLEYRRQDIVVKDRLYAAAADDLLEVLRELPAKVKCVMLFGHNPGLTDLAHRLAGEITHMSTCAVAEFSFAAKSWVQVGRRKPARVDLGYPAREKNRSAPAAAARRQAAPSHRRKAQGAKNTSSVGKRALA
jgi:phosphohistidine phosphatase